MLQPVNRLTIKCPCGGSRVQGTRAMLMRKAQALTLCEAGCGRRLSIQRDRKNGEAPYFFELDTPTGPVHTSPALSAEARHNIARATGHVLERCQQIEAMRETTEHERARKLLHVREFLIFTATYADAVTDAILELAGAGGSVGSERLADMLRGLPPVPGAAR